MKKARVAKQKAQQAKAKIKAAQPAAASPLPQAPLPETFTKNSFPKKASYIPGLYVPGNPEYKAEYGGGGWAAGVKEYDGPGFNSIEDLKTRFRELAASQSSSAGAPASGELTSTQPSSALGAAKSVKGLRGAGAVVSKGEFKNIMRSQGITAQQLLERAGRRGAALGAGVVNAANRGKLGKDSIFPYGLAGLGAEPNKFIQGMKGLTLSRGQAYMGTYEADGKQMPIVQARSAAPRGLGASQTSETKTVSTGAASGQTDYGVRPMSDEERKILTSGGSTPRWIAGLNAPGTENYDPEYGGGGWVSTKGIPGGTGPSGAATDEFMKAYSKASTLAKQLGQMGTGGSVESVYEMAKRFDEQQAQKPAATGLTGYSQPMQAGTAGEAVATSGGKVQKLLNKIQKTKALIKSSKSELAARGF